jgi:dihydroorotase
MSNDNHTLPPLLLPLLLPSQKPLLDKVPSIKVVMEHITTADAAEFVASAPDNVAASVTPQHMLLNRNALFAVSCGCHSHWQCGFSF